MQALTEFFAANGLIPHGYCLTWNSPLLWTTVLSDATMVLGYGSYPIAVTYFVWKRQDLEYRWLYLAFFNGFILTCTLTHEAYRHLPRRAGVGGGKGKRRRNFLRVAGPLNDGASFGATSFVVPLQ